MGLLFNSAEESEEIRGIKDKDLPSLTDTQLILLALARLYEAEGIDDDILTEELYRRGTQKG